MPEKDFIRAYPYNPVSGILGTTPIAVSTVRAPGASNGIIWASIPKYDGQWVNVPGSFAAFDAVTLQKLWSDDDDIAIAKFTPPTIAGGKVFRPTFANMLVVYGLTTPAPTPCYHHRPALSELHRSRGLARRRYNFDHAFTGRHWPISKLQHRRDLLDSGHLCPWGS